MSTSDKASDFVVRLDSPWNGGPPLERLGTPAVTPIPDFFVRNHGDLPVIDPESYRLRIEGEVETPLSLSLADLRSSFPRIERTATLQCAGNRREEMAASRPIPHELGWGSEAIGNACWGGVSLAEVLREAGLGPASLHVEFEGHDETERLGRRFRYGSSIPIEKATAREVLLAFDMNGQALPAAHGAPLRAVVPGYIGARSVKWLDRIVVRAEPSENYFQTHAYRLFASTVDADSVVWSEGFPLGELAVNSIITRPGNGDRLTAGPITVRGVSIAGSRRVERVEVSTDGGRSWQVAQLEAAEGPWAWTPWFLDLALPPGDHEIVARAWDSAAQTQPERPEHVWNFKGYMNNAWPRVRIQVGAIRLRTPKT
ncbi:MAG: sulfite oxidase [Thermoanaerobaculia bacterium]|nr:sulfite oxidase [Thermoanaerobaculia bacterium]